MALSIYEALQLPVMKNTKLVAGHEGLANNIKWVTIVEVVEDTRRLQEGEFLITTAFGLDKNEAQIKEFHKLLTSNKLSGIAIYTSFYMKEIPQSFISAANESGLPLIEIPTDINFSVITKALLEQIVHNQMHMLEFSATIHRQLTKLVLNNRGPTEITNTLAKLTNSTTIIFNDFYEIIHHHRNEDTITLGHQATIHIHDKQLNLKAHLLECMKQEATIHKAIDPYKITICPIIAKQACYGWVVIIKPIEKWKELDEIAVGHAATIYAIESLKKQAVEETKIRLQGDFLEDIFNENYSENEIVIEQAKKLGYDLTVRQTVIYFTFQTNGIEAEKQIDQLYYVIEQLLQQKNKQHLIQSKLDSLTLLTNVTGDSTTEMRKSCFQLAEEINDQWKYFFPKQPLAIGIGRHYDSIDMLAKCAREAHDAVKLSNLLHKQGNIYLYEDLGMYDLLLEMNRSGIELRTIYEDCLQNIVPTHDQSIDLIETLYVYLKNNQSIQMAADELFIHRHTLRYRLNQIEKRTGLNIKVADDRLRLQMAVMAYKLVEAMEHATL
ncbi:PucR family transcriptional regulator [Virgibacillus sp. W0430]|uniref:PucR family transcriptional regulator n=1 Tax=Virgibacillus sp. W0430 TaxID=3391580 RepID=UPI003F449037